MLAVMHAANKYAMTGLEAECANFLMTNLSADNVCAVLECAHCFSRQELRSHCIKFIKDNPGAFESEYFQNLCAECLGMILELDELVIQEEDLYESVMKWTDAQCQTRRLELVAANRRMVVEDVLGRIRFPLMSQRYFTDNVVSKELLTTEETVEVIKQMSGENIRQAKFCNRKRRGTKQFVCKRFSYERTDVRWERKTGRIDFYIDTHILITGLMLYNRNTNYDTSQDQSTKLEVYAALENSDNDEILTEVRKTVSIPDSSSMFRINFPQCIKLDPDIRYSVYVQKEGGHSNWGDGGMASVVTEGINFYFLTTYKSEQTNRAKGLLPGIVFCKLK